MASFGVLVGAAGPAAALRRALETTLWRQMGDVRPLVIRLLAEEKVDVRAVVAHRAGAGKVLIDLRRP